MEIITRLATSLGSLLKRSEIRYEVTETGVESCKIKTAFAVVGKFNINAMLIEIMRQANVL